MGVNCSDLFAIKCSIQTPNVIIKTNVAQRPTHSIRDLFGTTSSVKTEEKKMFEIKKSGQKFKLMDFSIYYILIVDGFIWNFKNHDSFVKP